MKTHCYELSVRTLISQEDGVFVAHALEMDLVACGKTEGAAREELGSLVCNQISFATTKGNPDMIFFPAPAGLIKRWEKAHEAQLKGIILSDRSAKFECKAVITQISEEAVRNAREMGRKHDVFDRIEGTELASA